MLKGLKLKMTAEELFKIYDRFSFDNLFRLLLFNGFDHEEALNFILCNCELSTLVFQERIYNKQYLDIRAEDTISSYQKFKDRFGGKVFVIFSFRKGKKEKEILNPEVIEEIKKEIGR